MQHEHENIAPTTANSSQRSTVQSTYPDTGYRVTVHTHVGYARWLVSPSAPRPHDANFVSPFTFTPLVSVVCTLEWWTGQMSVWGRTLRVKTTSPRSFYVLYHL